MLSPNRTMGAIRALVFGVSIASATVPACTFDTAGVPWPGECGNGVMEGGEECDLLDLGGGTCQSLGFAGGSLACSEACTLVTSACIPASAVCGDGVREGAELCDGDDLGGQTCATLDLGSGSLACTAQCTFNTQGCAVQPVCGNGQMEGAEECDDSNTTSCDGCSATCQIEACGNGRVECDEECDDENQDNTDACLNDCTQARCGDGHVQAGVEACDGANVPSTCVAEGFGGGILRCAPGCLSFDTSQCTAGDEEPCQTNDDCAGGICFAEASFGWPAGFCTRDCGGTGSSCGAGFACITISTNPTITQRCYKQCTTSAQCRTGYVCTIDIFQGVELLCRPACENNAHCPDTNICDPWTGWCGALANATHKDNGADCSSMGVPPCKGYCWPDPPGGYCVSPCNLSTGVCPGDGVCLDNSAMPAGDQGYCLDGCTGPGDCRSGYTCVTLSGSDPFCWPTSWL